MPPKVEQRHRNAARERMQREEYIAGPGSVGTAYKQGRLAGLERGLAQGEQDGLRMGAEKTLEELVDRFPEVAIVKDDDPETWAEIRKACGLEEEP